MKLFVTGAAGFVGAAVVGVASARDHDVVGLARSPAARPSTPRVRYVQGDVRQGHQWERELAACDAVIHLAAGKGGDFHSQFASTVIGTESLLAAMGRASVSRLVHVSTFSVYDYRALSPGDTLDERSPIEARPLDRDDYAQTKLVQERLVRDFAAQGGEVTIVRPGAVYGPGQLWNAGTAAVLPGGVGLAFAPRGTMKLTYVVNCAEAIVMAAERAEAIGETINVVDDDLPSQHAFARALRRHGLPAPRYCVPLPYRLVRSLAKSLDIANQGLVHGGAKLPGIVVPARLDAQFRPLHFANDHAKAVLGWRPRFTLDEALRRCVDAVGAG